MNTLPDSGKFQNIAQRVASTYARMLAEFCPSLPLPGSSALPEEMVAAQADLHAFFTALYAQIYAAPEQFGLPVTEDVFLAVNYPNEELSKAEINRKLDKPRKLLNAGLDFLICVGIHGWLEGDTLVFEKEGLWLAFKRRKSGQAWINGMQGVGMTLTEAGDRVFMANTRFPKMMPALQGLAQACADCHDPKLGQFFFARCDLKALARDFTIQALDLYRVFKPEEYARAAALHAYFTERNYQPQVEINTKLAWVVKYQGKKSIKATPLFQIHFDERVRHQLQAAIKCASAQRIAALLPDQSEALQEDFARRVHTCGDCHWCDNQKTLGPVVYTYQGEPRKICWYVMPDIDELTDTMVGLVQEYAQMHEALA